MKKHLASYGHQVERERGQGDRRRAALPGRHHAPHGPGRGLCHQQGIRFLRTGHAAAVHCGIAFAAGTSVRPGEGKHGRVPVSRRSCRTSSVPVRNWITPWLKGEKLVEVDNVMSLAYSVLRNRVIPSLLNVETASSKAFYPHRIFEVGEVAVFDASAEHGLPHGPEPRGAHLPSDGQFLGDAFVTSISCSIISAWSTDWSPAEHPSVPAGQVRQGHVQGNGTGLHRRGAAGSARDQADHHALRGFRDQSRIQTSEIIDEDIIRHKSDSYQACIMNQPQNKRR